MTRSRNTSPQTRKVLSALARQPQAWRYGYELMQETDLKSGTLYPLLIRLHDQGLLETEWRQSLEPGRPQRHACRLTAAGMALASVGQAADGLTAPTPAVLALCS